MKTWKYGDLHKAAYPRTFEDSHERYYPICSCCDEIIFDEKYIDIFDEIMCIECARDNAKALWMDYLEDDYLMDTRKYVEDEMERREVGE